MLFDLFKDLCHWQLDLSFLLAWQLRLKHRRRHLADFQQVLFRIRYQSLEGAVERMRGVAVFLAQLPSSGDKDSVVPIYAVALACTRRDKSRKHRVVSKSPRQLVALFLEPLQGGEEMLVHAVSDP